MGVSKEKIKIDSRGINPGDIFVAIRGSAKDGHEYVREAFQNGARSSVCEYYADGLTDDEKEKIIIVGDSRKALGEMLKKAFEDPSSRLTTYGVTGTNGKTTTVYLIDSILSSSGAESGFISTVSVKSCGNDEEKANMTTPDILSINRFFSEMLSSGKTDAVIEISSHALSQERISGIGLDYAVFTNLTPEHMDYHESMDSYLNAKIRIFDALKKEGTGVINIDDPKIRRFKKKISKCVTFGIDAEADIRAENIEYKKDATKFLLKAGKYGKIDIVTKLIGKHNVYNILGAAGCLLDRGIALDAVKEGIEKFKGVPGRLQEIFSKAPFKVFVDYAHTPIALENVLKCTKGISSGKLICVFGCGGDRDKEKRPVMGKIVSSLADVAILTSDNPRTEDPEEIIRQVEEGMEGSGHIVIPDRLEAIKESFERAQKDDVVVIAGKGHEDYQIVGKDRFYFDDVEVSKKILKEMNY
ncbi:MAG: UDP-N-acetylmuramoyl-L-alanyl-D-glutamate--2,6-diaminopimelate ligase [Candidatus Omnitrophota bacterium]